MLKFFKHSYVAQFVVIVLLMVVLWIPAIIIHTQDVGYDYPTTPLYNLLQTLLGFSNVAMTVLVMLVFVACVFLFNSMMSVDNLVTRNSSIASFVMVLCMCCVPIRNEYYPFLLALPFIMLAQQTVFLIYKVEKPERYLMNIGMFIAIASMFYIPSVILIIWILIAMAIHGIRGVRLYLIPLVGFITPYFIMTMLLYITGDLHDVTGDYANAFSGIDFMRFDITSMEKVVLLVMLVLSLISIITIWSNNSDKIAATRKRKSATMVMFIISILMLFSQNPVVSNGLFFFMAAVLVSMALCCVKKTKLVNIVMIVLMLAIVVNQYLPLFGVNI